MPAKRPSGPEWWVSAREGTLAPWAQAMVWALAQVNSMRDLWLTDDEIAACVTKVGGGQPSKMAVSKWRAIFKEDPDWYPGKTSEEQMKPGPKKVLTAQKASAIANSAMAMKR